MLAKEINNPSHTNPHTQTPEIPPKTKNPHHTTRPQHNYKHPHQNPPLEITLNHNQTTQTTNTPKRNRKPNPKNYTTKSQPPIGNQQHQTQSIPNRIYQHNPNPSTPNQSPVKSYIAATSTRAINTTQSPPKPKTIINIHPRQTHTDQHPRTTPTKTAPHQTHKPKISRKSESTSLATTNDQPVTLKPPQLTKPTIKTLGNQHPRHTGTINYSKTP